MKNNKIKITSKTNSFVVKSKIKKPNETLSRSLLRGIIMDLFEHGYNLKEIKKLLNNAIDDISGYKDANARAKTN